MNTKNVNDWQTQSISQIANIVSGTTPKSGINEYWNGDIVWITPDDLSKKEKYTYSSNRMITKLGLQKTGLRTIKQNSIVISSRAPIGYISIVKIPFTTNQGCKSLEIHNFNVEFIYYLLHTAVSDMQRLSNGTTFQEISKSQLERIELTIPISIKEQEKIAEILSITDDAIKQTEQLISKYKSIKQGLMQDLFQYGIDEKGQIRSEKTHKFKDSSLGRIPEEWEVVTASSLCEVRDGTHDSPKPSTAGYPLVTSKNITNGRLNLADTYLISEKDYVLVNQRSQVHQHDLLFSMIGTVGEAVLIEEKPQFAIKNVGLFLTGQNKFLGKWIFQFLKTRHAQKYIELNQKGTSQKYLPLGILREFPILWPTKEEERIRIIEKFNVIEDVISNEGVTKHKLLCIKQGLMQDLLTGKVRVNHLLN